MSEAGTSTALRADLGEVGISDIVRYAGASGDFNPIHHDPGFAAASGVPGVFAMGMLTAAWAAGWIESVLGDALRSLDLRFTDRVWPQDRLRIEAQRVDGGVDGAVLRGQGETVLSFAARTEAPPPAAPGGRDAGDTLLAGPFRWRIEEGAVRDFRRAARDDSAVTPGAPAPPTFVATLHRWSPLPGEALIARVGFDFHRMLHGSTRIELPAGPLRAGEELEVEQWLSPRRTKPGRRGGEMTFADVVDVVRDSAGRVRARVVTTLIELPAAAPVAPAHLLLDPPRLAGSRDPVSGVVFFPPRALGVDGELRECEAVELSQQGTLYSWVELGGEVYGWVDLPEGVRLQTRLGGDAHEIGATYAIDVEEHEGALRWRFVRA